MFASLIPSVVMRHAASIVRAAATVPALYHEAQAQAEHSCADWEYTPDEDSPLEWCAGCRHSENLRQANPTWQGARSGPLFTPEQIEAQRVARWNAWVKTLPQWDIDTLRAGGLAAKILVRESFHGERIGWAAKLEMMNPDFFKGRAPAPLRRVKVVVAKAKKPAFAAAAKAGWAALDFSDSDDSSVEEAALDAGFHAPAQTAGSTTLSPADMTFEEYDRFCQEKEQAVARKEQQDLEDGWCAAGAKPRTITTPDPFSGLAVEAWLARKYPENTGGARAARQRELDAWINESPRRAFTSNGYKPYKNYASAGRSSALFSGADGIDIADIREIAALIAPVRDIFRPRSNSALIFVEYLSAGAAAQAKLVFGEHPLRMWNRAIYVDVAKAKPDQKPKGK